MFPTTVILRDNGIDRTYKCDSRWDAEVLFAALTKLGRRVEMWDSAECINFYQPIPA